MVKRIGKFMEKNVATVPLDSMVSEAVKIMGERDIGSVVVAEEGKVLGIVTERDLARKVIFKNLDPQNVKVSEIMTKEVITTSPNATVLEAARVLKDNKIKKLPVVEGGKLVGIVTETSVTEALREELVCITPLQEELEKTNGKYILEPGTVYLIKEDKEDKGFDLFVDAVMQGLHGLCITRKHPKRIQEQHKLEKTPIIWLTDASTQHKTIPPTGVNDISMLVSKFIDDVDKCVIMLDGLEYLIAHNNFNQTLRLIHALRDRVAESNSYLIIPVIQNAWDQRELKLVESEMDVIITDLKEIRKKLEKIENKSNTPP